MKIYYVERSTDLRKQQPTYASSDAILSTGGGIRRLWPTRSYLGTGTLTFCRKLWRANSTLTGGGELESGQTAIAFTPLHQLETDGRTGAVQSPTRTWAWTWPTCGWSRTERYR
ncbi:uncharacterized protein LOC135586274 isoform X1 [Musa acuminata AAA Group]|uniref:uncharacterized protein LOC103969858 isoform X2 n=1 Tax=Musa acuminata AAA Group TaxID=214697 RepID=UPI0031D44494